MRIGMFSPTYPPDRCGVGDYAFCLLNELIHQGHEVILWSEQNSEDFKKLTRGTTTYHLPRPWTYARLCAIETDIKRENLDFLLFQYTPLLIAPKHYGICLTFPWIIRRFQKQFNIPVVITMHELHYPVQLNFRGITLGITQKIQSWLICFFTHKVVFSYDYQFFKYKKIFYWKETSFSWVSVGSTIHGILSFGKLYLTEKVVEDHALLKKIPAEKDRFLLYFGGGHPSHLIQYILSVINALTKRPDGSRFLLIMIGVSDEWVKREIKKLKTPIPNDTILALGYLSFVEVAAWIKLANWILAPFVDGISTRRSSVMAALQAGKTVISTRGPMTGSIIPWESFCVLSKRQPLAEDKSLQDYVQVTLAAIDNPAQSQQFSNAAARYFQAHFSWDNIAKQILGLVQK